MANKPNKLRHWLRSIAKHFGIINPDDIDNEVEAVVDPITNTTKLHEWQQRQRYDGRTKIKMVEDEPLPASTALVSYVPLVPDKINKAKRRLTPRRIALAAIAVLVVVVAIGATSIVVSAMMADHNNGSNAVADTTSSPSVEASPSVSVLPSLTAINGGTTWKMVEGDYAHNRWFGDGIAAIRNAKTKADAQKAAFVWLDRVKRDPVLLIGATAYFFPHLKVTKASLVTVDGWATDKAVQLVAQLQMALAQAKVSPSLAPSDGTNSGVDGKHVVSAYIAGINGDRRAILIVLPKDTKLWVMSRCGNIVTQGHPPVPPGKTELQPKNWRQDPYPQGNAPIGGGQNADPGPGDYQKPGTVTPPPKTPYTAPPSPTPTSTPSGGGGQIATPDPQPTPTPEDTGPPNTGTV